MWNKNKQALQIKISKLNAGQRDFLLTFEAWYPPLTFKRGGIIL